MNQEEEFEADEWALDDVTGQWLDGGKVADAVLDGRRAEPREAQ